MNNTTQLNKKPTESENFYCVLKKNNQHLYFKGRCNQVIMKNTYAEFIEFEEDAFGTLAIIPLENMLFVGRTMEDKE